MKLEIALRLLKLLPATEAAALTVAELAARWPNWRDMKPESRDHTMRRWIRELSEYSATAGADWVRQATDPGRGESRYYRDQTAAAALFMPAEVSMMLVTAGQIFDRTLGPDAGYDLTGARELADAAIKKTGNELRNLVSAIRILSDGIARLDASVEPEVLSKVILALSRQRQLSFQYGSVSGPASGRTVHPLGLVVKDGARYLVAREVNGRTIKQFVLHRMRGVEVLPSSLAAPWGFNLDQYVDEFFNGGSQIALELRVHRDAIWHFQERPLVRDQIIGAEDARGWCRVTATVRQTIQLTPFLLSMGGWVEVVSPEAVRNEVATRAFAIANHYRCVDGQPTKDATRKKPRGHA